MSLALGTVAMVLCMLQPGNTSTSSGFFASTVGISAVAYGIHSLSLRRRGLATVRLVPWVGIVFGVIGTAIMAFFLVSFSVLTGEWQAVLLNRSSSTAISR